MGRQISVVKSRVKKMINRDLVVLEWLARRRGQKTAEGALQAFGHKPVGGEKIQF